LKAPDVSLRLVLEIIPESEINFMRKFIVLLCLFSLLACQSESRKASFLKDLELITPNGDKIDIILVYKDADMEQGLSGTKPQDFDDNQGMLFYYLREDEKNFWMPDTYFDLDLFYLNQELQVIDIIRKLPHYVGRANQHLIPRARPVWARHVLEMKASSEIAQRIKMGDKLVWKARLTQAEAELQIKAELSK
jgi:uncharacterized protein